MNEIISDIEGLNKRDQRIEDIRKQEINDIKTVLNNASGKRFMWRLLSKCNTYGSIFNTDEKYMAYLSGQQDLGHFLISEIAQADENLYLKIVKENMKHMGAIQ